MAASPPRLVELASEWLLLIAALRVATEIPDPARLRERALELRNGFERAGREAGFADADLESASFSLTAFLDETLRRARGKARDEWISRPLQLEWFRTNTAGVEFYERLEAARKERVKRAEAIEVAASCVSLGFEGRLATDPGKRAGLLEELLADVAAVRGSGEVPLAPHVIARDTVTGTVVPELSRWISIGVFGIAAMLLWLAITQVGHLAAVRAADRINRTAGR